MKHMSKTQEALAEQPAQQEPVAWQVEVLIQGVWSPMGNPQRDKSKAERLADNPSIPKECQRVIELYTSPPASKPWVGLTEEQVFELIEANTEWKPAAGLWRLNEVEFARAIEAKLKEKNT